MTRRVLSGLIAVIMLVSLCVPAFASPEELSETPGSTEAAPADAEPMDLEPTESDPAEPEPTESDPAEPEPAEPGPTEPEPAEPEQTDTDIDLTDAGPTEEPAEEDAPEAERSEGVVLNSFYGDLLSAAALSPAAEPVAEPVAASSVEDAGSAVRALMKARQATIAVTVPGASFDLAEAIVSAALRHTGVPTEGDYLACQLAGYTWTGAIRHGTDGASQLEVQYTMTYLSTAQQEQQTEQAARELLAQLPLAGMDSFEKLSAICAALGGNARFGGSGAGYSAFEALCEGQATYQGWAAALYRLCLEAGVDCRIVSGSSEENGRADRAWLLVRLADQYYWLDPALYFAGQQAAVTPQGSRSFSGCPADEYQTAAWLSAHPVSEDDYAPAVDADPPIETTVQQETLSGWVKQNGKWYYYADGQMLAGQVIEDGGSRYFLGDDGVMKTGWIKADGSWYYANKSGVLQSGWVKDAGKWYYLDPETNQMATGMLQLDGETYYLDGSGVMKTGWIKADSSWYYANKSGVLQYGWQKVAGKWYYLDPETNQMATGMLQLDGETYYLDGSGVMKTGWIQADGSWYYANKSGVLQSGWVKDAGKWYYLDPETNQMATGMLQLDGETYYLDGSGVMKTGWIKADSSWYYANKSGVLQYGWLTLKSVRYWLKEDGRMACDETLVLDGVLCTFASSGALLSSTPVGPEEDTPPAPADPGKLPQLDQQTVKQTKDLMAGLVINFNKYDFGDDDTVLGLTAIDFLVTYLGREEEAMHSSGNSFMSYAKNKGILTEEDPHRVGESPVKVADCVTWFLRAMGYVSGTDFDSASPLALSDQLGITKGLYAGTETQLIRWMDLLYLAKNALTATCKAGGTLWQAICTDRWLYVNEYGSWHMDIRIFNPTSGTITLTDVTVLHTLNDGTVVGRFHHAGTDLIYDFINPSIVNIPAGSAGYSLDNHPLVDQFDRMVYEYKYRTADGGTYVQTCTFLLDHTPYVPELPDFSGDNGKDVDNLCYNAQFEVEVFPGVYWVPVNTLGGSRYTNAQIGEMLTLSPEEKQAKISTLYEALQLYKIGNFYSSDDNVRIYENGINWEHHKPGYHAVRTNTGCCASDSDWLRYILDGDYDEVGFITTSQRDGSGHVYNCIQQDGWYYFIDLTHQLLGTMVSAKETGRMEDYQRSDRGLGNFFRTRDLQSYVDFVQNVFFDPPGLMFLESAPDTADLDGVFRNGKIYITYTDDPAVTVKNIFDDPNDQLEYAFAPAPTSEPDWSALPSFDFSKK